MKKEIWESVPNFPLYEVSDWGNVRSLPSSYERKEWRHGHKQIVKLKGRLLGGWIKRNYLGKIDARLVALRRDGKTHITGVHRLVLLAFRGPAPNGMECCHNDGNPLNNKLNNLRWDTHKNNQADMLRHGTMSTPPVHFGETLHNARLTDKQIAQIRKTPILHGTKSRLARDNGVSLTSISRFLAGKVRVV